MPVVRVVGTGDHALLLVQYNLAAGAQLRGKRPQGE
jgi:hypothetical protein